MPFTTRLAIALGSFVVMLTIVQLVRRKRLDPQYALLWLVAGAAMIIAPLSLDAIDEVAVALGFYYPPAIVLLIGIVALSLINLQFSVVITRLSDHNRQLAQQYALIERRLAAVEAREHAPLP